MSGRCLSTYVDLEEEGYSSAALRRLADGRAFPARLDYDPAQIDQVRREQAERISISGVQEKISLRLHRGRLSPVTSGGQYLLKPVPSTPLPRFQADVPANESLTMQLAEQVFGVRCAASALIRLSNDDLAYITRRFDRSAQGEKIAQEDFCQLMGDSPAAPRTFKYDASYEELAAALKRYCPAYLVEVEELFRRIVFNYLVGNGDAHLKNFSLRKTTMGDYILSPAYDLLATKIHLPDEARMALELYAGDREPAGLSSYGFLTGADFREFAGVIGLRADRAEKILTRICGRDDEVRQLIERSFLSPEARQAYRAVVTDRRRALQMG